MTPSSPFGVLYFVDANPQFERMLAISIASLRRFHPDWPIRIMRCPSPSIPAWKHLYRALSFWKWAERRRRANQDWRVLFAKASGMLETPFDRTLYLDADTVVMRPLDGARAAAGAADVTATLLPGKTYKPFLAWQPATIPMIMSGVVFYNRHFAEVYREDVARLRQGAGRYFAGDQYMFSTTLATAGDRLAIRRDPTLQIDAMNIAGHLGTDAYPRAGDALDLRCPELERFHIFHYNGPHKRAYLDQIADVWGLPGHAAIPAEFWSP